MNKKGPFCKLYLVGKVIQYFIRGQESGGHFTPLNKAVISLALAKILAVYFSNFQRKFFHCQFNLDCMVIYKIYVISNYVLECSGKWKCNLFFEIFALKE